MCSKAAALCLDEGLEQQKGDTDGDVVMGGGYSMRSDSERSESELCAFTLEARNVPEDD